MLAIDRVPSSGLYFELSGLYRETWLMDARMAADISVSRSNLPKLPMMDLGSLSSAALQNKMSGRSFPSD
jgi:hypothetical protein